MAEMGGFQPVRSRACNLVSGHSVYGVAGPMNEPASRDVLGRACGNDPGIALASEGVGSLI
jgi:hypothetical protein